MFDLTVSQSFAEEEDSTDFGAEAPPLTKQIESILRRYPDGGQILKVTWNVVAVDAIFFRFDLKLK